MPSLQWNSASSSSPRRIFSLKIEAGNELERCLRSGTPCRVEDLLARYPELNEHPPLVLELIDLEYLLRESAGLAPSVDDYCQRFPQWRDSLRTRLSNLSKKRKGEIDQAETLAEGQADVAGRNTSSRRAGQRLLGQYELFERIGRGGMGHVYRARQGRPLDRIVALKLLHSGDDFEIHTFEKEIEVARRLHHPHLLPIYDAGQIDGEYYYTMPLATGGSLERRLQRGRPDVRWTVDFIEKVARAVHYAHQQNVLHRDLKPANILLDERDEPLVSDFGLAKLLDRNLGHTRSGQMLGSVPYMSPEQARGRGCHATPSSDVWALGVILYEMLTGQRPFQGGTQTEVLTRIQRVEPFRPSQLEADVPADVETICLRCLEKDPVWRYASAEELADDLARWRGGHPLANPSPGMGRRLVYSIQRFLTPRAAAVALGCVMLLLSLCLLLVPAINPTTSQTETPTSETNLLREEAHAGPNRPLVLFPRQEGLAWSKVLVGQDPRKKASNRFQNLTLETFSQALLEILPPNAQRKGGRLTFEMRQCGGDGTSLVGVYLGRQRNAHALGVFHSGIELTYDDAMAPPDNLLCVGARCITDRRESFSVPYRAQLPGLVPMRPVDRRNDNSYWRTLTCDFGAEGIVVSTENNVKGRYSSQDMDAAFHRIQKHYRDLAGPALFYSPSGGIGIYIHKASVEIRRIEFAPLGLLNQ